MRLADIPQLQGFTKEEKLQLVEDLWDSIATTPDDLPISDTEKSILDGRLAAHVRNPDAALPLSEFKKRLAAKL